ncbi:MAG: hypothetical protein HYZ73_06450 [Elusimicrobia bacterium]|nr:hypothetical protein [Elusimicrobiota bacterium]
MPISLEHEYQVFNQRRPELVSKGEHKFVVIKGDKILDIYTSYEDALKDGLRQFGNVPFLIKEIEREENVHFFHSHLT